MAQLYHLYIISLSSLLYCFLFPESQRTYSSVSLSSFFFFLQFLDPLDLFLEYRIVSLYAVHFGTDMIAVLMFIP